MITSTVRKIFILLSSTFLGLICGTLYLYSSYSPQFAKQLHYSATDSSHIALIGTLGVSITGPFAGVVVDRKGYTVSMLIGGLSIITGYLGLQKQYINVYSNVMISSSLLFLVGLGSTFINSSCLKCCATNFPSIRGVATSLPLALYGLSALFYSLVASIFYAGDTYGFLGFLSYSSIAIFCICAPSLMLCDWDQPTKKPATKMTEQKSIELTNLRLNGIALSPQVSNARAIHSRLPSLSHDIDVSGLELVKTLPFWQLFFITGALAAMGQMYIYSVGYIVDALISSETIIAEDSIDAASQLVIIIQKNQQYQVGLLSIANCVGRISSGILGDIIAQSYRKPRSLLLFIPAIGMALSQWFSINISSYQYLSFNSLIVGFFYGFTFCIMPMITGDKFGMLNFSYNWGLMGLAPILPSFYFTSLFGKIYDSNSILTENSSALHCSSGYLCYNSIFKLTACVSILTIIMVYFVNFRKSQNLPKHIN